MSRTGRTSTSEPGRNARTFSISTVKPPLTRPVMMPVTISELLNAVSRRVQVRARLAFSRDRRVSPLPSSTVSSATSTSSPALTSISPRSFLNCSRGMTASDFRPDVDDALRRASTSTMSPVRIMPGRMRWLARLCFEKLGETFCHDLHFARPIGPRLFRARIPSRARRLLNTEPRHPARPPLQTQKTSNLEAAHWRRRAAAERQHTLDHLRRSSGRWSRSLASRRRLQRARPRGSNPADPARRSRAKGRQG